MYSKKAIYLLILPYIILLITNIFLLLIPVMPKNFILFLDKVRPAYEEISLEVHVQKQVFHLMTMNLHDNLDHRIIFVGSSSVVNGLDVNLIKQIFRANNLGLNPFNYGLTGFMAYELPFMKNMFLDHKVDVVVFLYNTFSFTGFYHPQAINIRWDANEYRGIAGRNMDRNLLFKNRLNDLFPVIRYGFLFINYCKRFLLHKILPLPYDYDYPPGLPQPSVRPRIKQQTDDNNWLRKCYLSSDTDDETLGYKGLIRFLKLSKEKNIKVIVAPILEPEFADYGQYRQGINVGRIDNHVKRIALACGALYIPRAIFSDIENNDKYFKDDVHMHDLGRELYSKLLAKILIRSLSQIQLKVDGG